MSVDATQVVQVLGELASVPQKRSLASVDVDLMEWLPLSYTNLLNGLIGYRRDRDPDDPLVAGRTFRNTATTRRIFKTAKLRAGDDEEGVLRAGWLWLAGRHPEYGKVMTPLVSLPVRRTIDDRVAAAIEGVMPGGADAERNRFADITDEGEPELTDLIADDAARQHLGVHLDFDPLWASEAGVAASRASLSKSGNRGLRDWAFEAAAAAGCPTDALAAARRPPSSFQRRNQLVVVAGMALYVAPARPAQSITNASTMQSWAQQDIDDTALAVLYASDDIELPTARAVGQRIDGPFELNAAQRSAVDAVERQRLTVLSGPPGTGKTQTVAAVAFDQVRRGRSVLVVAPTNAAVSALTTLMEQTPGPDPVVFGSSSHRVDVANHLTEQASSAYDVDVVAQRTEIRERVGHAVARLREVIVDKLDVEYGATADPVELTLARAETPGFFEVDADLEHVRQLINSAAAVDIDKISRRQRRRARKDLQRLVEVSRARESFPIPTFARYARLAIGQRRRAESEALGGLDLDPLWGSLIDGLKSERDASGVLLDVVTHQRDRTDRKSQRAIAAVAAALRSGRERRRSMLADVDAAELLEPLPLWVSTLRDVDDLLPMRPAMFDLVIVDEASHIDQVSAAPALLRAHNALVVGDPRQLRHVSFVSSDRIDRALTECGVSDMAVAAQLDVQRNSLFDAAAGVQPPLLLDEHYRSAPHLIDFSSERFYDGRVGVATRHPRNEGTDCIDVIEVDGTRDASGINRIEIATIVEHLRGDLAAGRDSIGVIAPFRAQADAIEDALRDAFELSEIDQLDLRVGTVHGFQGCQRDLTYLSMCLDDESPAGSRTFVDDAALFNVMVTRARDRVVVVTSMRHRRPALLTDYVRHAADPQVSGFAASPTDPSMRPWQRRVVDELRDAGLSVRTGYPVGRHEIDVVVGTGDGAMGIICGVHPQGPEAHIERHVELTGLGWVVRESFESRWGNELPALAVDLRTTLAR